MASPLMVKFTGGKVTVPNTSIVKVSNRPKTFLLRLKVTKWLFHIKFEKSG